VLHVSVCGGDEVAVLGVLDRFADRIMRTGQ
jgi:hypothetical protein